MSHCLCLLRCCELSLPVSLLGLGLDLSIACAIQSFTYSNDACQSDNVCLRPLKPILVLSSFGKYGGLSLFYTLEDHAPSNLVYNIRFDPCHIAQHIFDTLSVDRALYSR